VSFLAPPSEPIFRVSSFATLAILGSGTSGHCTYSLHLCPSLRYLTAVRFQHDGVASDCNRGTLPSPPKLSSLIVPPRLHGTSRSKIITLTVGSLLVDSVRVLIFIQDPGIRCVPLSLVSAKRRANIQGAGGNGYVRGSRVWDSLYYNNTLRYVTLALRLVFNLIYIPPQKPSTFHFPVVCLCDFSIFSRSFD
jgi:hypothetical protein